MHDDLTQAPNLCDETVFNDDTDFNDFMVSKTEVCNDFSSLSLNENFSTDKDLETLFN